MRNWRLLSVAMVIAVLISVIGVGAAQGAVAPNQVEQPKVTALALPFAWVDTAFPVLVIVKNQEDSAIDDPQICIEVSQDCTIVLPEDDACQEPWFGIRANGYAFAIWFVECSVEADQEIVATITGEIGGALVSGSDSVEIELWD
ncbi:MAG TPA: hypothetical protein VN415_08150 [Dehalococcoidia bacterium]|nr:hypothetical protein [Dehalococcoidia bacterium]